ncbi:[protein-PII] uridylyltransferase [bacterium]|nr:[protein-PII] uridylyltransferase [bacterium]
MPATTTRISQLRQQVEGVRELTQKRMASHATGLQIAASICQWTDEFLNSLNTQALAPYPESTRNALAATSAMIAVGGSGRGDYAPYSDVDLLFLEGRGAPPEFHTVVSQIVRDCWDAGLKLGHSVRTLPDTIKMARQDTQFATSLVDTRCLWGSQDLVQELTHRFQRQVVESRIGSFIEECVSSRAQERAQHGAAVLQLEPDIKRSFGGLRDLHLLRWVGFARHGVSDLNSLKLQGALSQEDVRRLVLAHDYLMSVRINLHLSAGRPQDILTRDEQLRISEERRIPETPGQRSVERFMQEYFQHSLAIAEISSDFVARNRQHPVLRQVANFVMSYRVDNKYRVGLEYLDVIARHRDETCRTLEGALEFYDTAATLGKLPHPQLALEIKAHAANYPRESLSEVAQQTFLKLLKRPGHLEPVLRSMFDTGVLECVLPAMSHVRCLLQFNQYHSYTVDEHTLRAIGACEARLKDPGPIGRAYREVNHKELLHLALLLHDAGKGYEEDHSEVGKRLAEEAAVRLGLPDHQRDIVVFLVHRHLLMATLAFRRDISDPEVLLKFNHEVGSANILRKLFVLTAADIEAVGPGVWNDWKAELLTLFYDRSMVWLSGKSDLFQEPVRVEKNTGLVLNQLPAALKDDPAVLQRLQTAPPHYLIGTRPERIAQDLEIISGRTSDDISIEGHYDSETSTVEYRVITSEAMGVGCFHKLTGVLSAKRMEILNAQICTYPDGIIIDSFRVRDYDHEYAVPEFRLQEVAELMRKALRNEIDVETLFRSRLRFSPNAVQGPVSNLPMRVLVDNESSDRCTVVDIFAHDRSGLLYRISRCLFELDLSVILAKISTHFDQVVDVFYVTDSKGRKIVDGQRLRTIREVLRQHIEQFEETTRDGSLSNG